jgi:hypothetical protein
MANINYFYNDVSPMLTLLISKQSLLDNEKQYCETFYEVGKCWGSDKALVRATVILHQNRLGYSVSPNTNHRWINFTCESNACTFRMSLSLASDKGTWNVSFYSPHTCTEIRPTKTLLVTDLVTILNFHSESPIHMLTGTRVTQMIKTLHLYPPQWQEMRKFANLSHRVITAAKHRCALGAAPSATLLPSLTPFSGLEDLKLKFQGEGNQLIIKTDDLPTGDKIYRASYFILGPVLKMAQHPRSTLQLDVDGSFFKNASRQLRMPGRCKAIVLSDANGHIFPLILCHDMQPESNFSWANFFEVVFEVLPQAATPACGIASDRHSGLMKQLRSMSAAFNYTKLGSDFSILNTKDDEIFEVDSIVAFKKPDRYQIRWKGGATTWEPLKNLTGCSQKLKEFRATQTGEIIDASSDDEEESTESEIPVTFAQTSASSEISTNSEESSDSDEGSTESESMNDDYPSGSDGFEGAGPGWVSCLQHFRMNVRWHMKPFGRPAQDLACKTVMDIAYSKTTEGALYRLKRVKHTNPALWEYLAKIDPSLWIQPFWRPGRHIARTSNSVESFWSEISIERYFTSIPHFFITIYQKTQEKIRQTHSRAHSYEPLITPFASRQMTFSQEELTRNPLKVEVKFDSDNKPSQGLLKDTWNREFLCQIHHEKITCTCTLRQICYFPCSHVIAFANRIRLLPQAHLLVAPCYKTTSWRETLDVACFPPLGFVYTDLNPYNSFGEPSEATPVKSDPPPSRARRSTSFSGTPPTDMMLDSISDFFDQLGAISPSQTEPDLIDRSSNLTGDPHTQSSPHAQMPPEFQTDPDSQTNLNSQTDANSQTDPNSQMHPEPQKVPQEQTIEQSLTPDVGITSALSDDTTNISNLCPSSSVSAEHADARRQSIVLPTTCAICLISYRRNSRKWTVCDGGKHRLCSLHSRALCGCLQQKPIDQMNSISSPSSPDGPPPRPPTQTTSRASRKAQEKRKRSRGEISSPSNYRKTK